MRSGWSGNLRGSSSCSILEPVSQKPHCSRVTQRVQPFFVSLQSDDGKEDAYFAASFCGHWYRPQSLS